MKRLFLLLIAVLLPLQLAWGAAATYCQHETTRGQAHFGHHEHVHKADHGHGKAGGGKVADDPDCGFCNTATSAVIPAFDAPPSQAPVLRAPGLPREDKYASAPQRAPDRPQWRCLA